MTSVDTRQLDRFTSKLLEWWNPTQFDYPWRRVTSPYNILVSEFLLRKTAREQVKRIYEDFFLKYPTIQSLSDARIESIEETIKPLGMQHIKAIALRKLAETIVKEYDGKIPRDKNPLQKLPGVGVYIANAVLCFAYGENLPLLDTNTARVLERVFSLKSSRRRVRDDPKMWKVASLIMPKKRARDFNLAIIDFAGFICLSRKPRCNICPIKSICLYFKTQVAI